MCDTQGMTPLCVFFGPRITEDFTLPLLSTFLNVNDWQLKTAYLRQIVGVSAYVLCPLCCCVRHATHCCNTIPQLVLLL